MRRAPRRGRACAMGIALAVASCAGSRPPAPSGEDAAAGARAADAALDRVVAARDPAAFAGLVCADALFAGRARLNAGREAVLEAWAGFLEPGGPSLRWAPERSGAARSGDLAWTVGRWTFRGKDGEARGEYATVWRRQENGWCALLDMGLEPAAARGALVREPVRSARSAAGDLEAEMGRFRSAPAAGQDPVEGAYLTVRRRAADGAREAVIESAVAFARQRPERR